MHGICLHVVICMHELYNCHTGKSSQLACYIIIYVSKSYLWMSSMYSWVSHWTKKQFTPQIKQDARSMCQNDHKELWKCKQTHFDCMICQEWVTEERWTLMHTNYYNNWGDSTSSLEAFIGQMQCSKLDHFSSRMWINLCMGVLLNILGFCRICMQQM